MRQDIAVERSNVRRRGCHFQEWIADSKGRSICHMRHIALAALGAWSLAVALAATGVAAEPPDTPAWNARAAAAYLDGEMEWWSTWPNAARDHGTFCVSCHTVAPYVLARPALAAALKETELTPPARKLFDNVATRVRLWNEVAPYYPDQRSGLPKTSESRGTESVLNALVLSTRDSHTRALSAETKQAFDHMWALQMRTGPLDGAWAWLNFHLEPWESDGAPYFGAAMAVAALATAPGSYAESAEAKAGVDRLRRYISSGFDAQNLFNQLTMIVASRRFDGLVTAGAASGRCRSGCQPPAGRRRLEPEPVRDVRARRQDAPGDRIRRLCHGAGRARLAAGRQPAPATSPDARPRLAAKPSGRERPLGGDVAEQAAGSRLRPGAVHERRGHGVRRDRPHRALATRPAMKLTIGLMTAAAFAMVGLETQSPPDTVESHVAAARAAAGTDFTGLADRLCTAPAPQPPAASTAPAPARREGPPPRDSWHAEPVKVFDNLYFVGETGVLGVGGHHLRRHHHHRPDLRLLGRRRGRRRAAQAGPRSGRRSSTCSSATATTITSAARRSSRTASTRAS